MTEKEFSLILIELFEIQEKVTPILDLSDYIKDSIDLGELVAVVKMRHGLIPADWEFFKTKPLFQEVYNNFISKQSS